MNVLYHILLYIYVIKYNYNKIIIENNLLKYRINKIK